MSEAVTAIRPKVEKPTHIPDSLVYEFDLHNDAGLAADPHERILEIVRDTPPVFWTPCAGGQWVIRGHEAVYKASRDWETFTSESRPYHELVAMQETRPEGAPHVPIPLPINVDPPIHTIFRAPLQKAFSPRSVMALQQKIRSLADELIDAVKPDGGCEFMYTIAEPLPVKVFLELLGMPSENYPEYRTLIVEYMKGTNGPIEDSIKRTMEVAAVMRPTLLERQKNPKDDIISLLWQAEIDGRPTTLEDLENYGVLLFVAGLDTVMNGIGHAVRHLAMHLDLQERLRADPKLIPEASEEMLRRYTFTVPPRFVKKDCTFEGVEMKAGERALLFLPAADLDPAEFAEPEKYSLERENNVHIAFGVGPHRCLGSHLARVELQILYEQMLSRLPEFRVDPACPPRFHGGNVIGIDRLNLVWDA